MIEFEGANSGIEMSLLNSWNCQASRPARLLAIACHKRLSHPAVSLNSLNLRSSGSAGLQQQLQTVEFYKRSCPFGQPNPPQSSYQPDKP